MRDHRTEIPHFCCVIAAFQCYKLFDRGRLAVALHYTEFEAIFVSFAEISTTQRASFPLGRTQVTIGRCVCRCVKSRRLPVDRRRSTMTSTTGQLLAISTPPPHNNICLDELRSCRAGSLSPLPPTTHNGRSHSRASINA